MGKPAPPSPQQPLSLTAARKLLRSVIMGGFTSGQTVCKPSVSMTAALPVSMVTALQVFPLASLISVTALTVPDTLE